MKQEVWVCLVRYLNTSCSDNVSCDGYSTLELARTALEARLGNSGHWASEFAYMTTSAIYELKCVVVEA
jgi:hypothetical protein